MSEWWTYRPSDFLMFAPSTYWRLFELHNQALWPAPIVLIVLATLWFVWRARCGTHALRLGIAGLAVAWAGVGWSFLWLRFEPIHWVAVGFAWGFGLQAAVLVLMALMAGGLGLQSTLTVSRSQAGLALLALALWAHPLLAPAAGRPWAQAEVFGLAPDPTAIATLGVLLGLRASTLAGRWICRMARVLPLAWCAISAATLATMQSAQAMVPGAAFVLAVTVLLMDRDGTGREGDRLQR